MKFPISLSLTLLFALFTTGEAQVRLVDKVLQGQPVARFTNYTGEVAKPDRVEDIIGIGRILATGLSNDSVKLLNKYALRRVIASNRVLYSADIFSIGSEARVDHIKNVRRILAGHIATAFKRPLKEAQTLALFVAYYNSALRKDPALLAKYAPAVVQSVDPAKAGISLNYKDWPGQTEMLIPLDATSLFGITLGSEEIYDRAAEEMKSLEDKGVREREEMLATRQTELQQKRQELDKALDANQRRTEQLQDTVKKLEEGDPSPARDQKLEEAKKIQEGLDQDRQKLLAEQDRLAADRLKLEAQKADLAKDMKEVNYSGVETQKHLYFMRFQRQEKNVIFKELTAIIKETLTIGRVKKGVTGMNTPIYGQDLFSVYPDAGNKKFLLTLFDGETFDIIRQSSQGLYPNTYLDEDLSQVYAVIDVGGKTHLGQFAADTLRLVRRTEQQVFPNTGIVISSDKIYLLLTEGKNLKIGAFRKEDLSFIQFVE